jgi:hypothetical protein
MAMVDNSEDPDEEQADLLLIDRWRTDRTIEQDPGMQRHRRPVVLAELSLPELRNHEACLEAFVRPQIDALANAAALRFSDEHVERIKARLEKPAARLAEVRAEIARRAPEPEATPQPDSEPAQPPSTESLPSHKAPLQFPNRAAWLKERLRERHWSKLALERKAGPGGLDHKTIQKVLDGVQVTNGVLDRLASALSNYTPRPGGVVLNRVTEIDIPRD